MNRIAHRSYSVGALAMLVGCVADPDRRADSATASASRDSQVVKLERQMERQGLQARVRDAQLRVYGFGDDSMEFRGSPVMPVSENQAEKLSCAAIPTPQEVQTGRFDFNSQLYSKDKAIRLGIPLIGASGSTNTMVLVVNYERSRECETQNPDVRLVYGHWIRTVITLNDYQSQAGINFSLLAASGTLRNQSQSIQVTSEGIFSQQLNSLIAGISNKSLNVENYALFMTFLSQMQVVAYDTIGTKTEVRLLGRREEPQLARALSASFALHEISRGRTCAETKKSLPQGLQSVDDAVEDVYKSIAGICDNATRPGPEFIGKAKTRLHGFRINRQG